MMPPPDEVYFVPSIFIVGVGSTNTSVSLPAEGALNVIDVAVSILRHCVRVLPSKFTVPFDVERLPEIV